MVASPQWRPSRARRSSALRTSADPADRVAYARDLWPRHHLAVRAGRTPPHRARGRSCGRRTTDEVAKIVRWAHDTGTSVVPFGAGSGVCGGVLPARRRGGRRSEGDGPRPRRSTRAPCRSTSKRGIWALPLEERLGPTRAHARAFFRRRSCCSSVGGLGRRAKRRAMLRVLRKNRGHDARRSSA